MKIFKIGDDFLYKGKIYKIYDVFKDTGQIIIKRGSGIDASYIKLSKAAINGNNT